jgi:AAA domain, putative AbiEii toxin, Type IV TA system/AAA ATPase domain
MIRKVVFRNFKGLRQVDVDLERLTIFVGPNSSGKTSILEGLNFVARRWVPPGWGMTKRDPSILRSRGARGEICLGWENELGGFRFTRSPAGDDGNGTAGWREDQVTKAATLESPTWDPIPSSTELIQALPPAVLLRLDAAELAAPSYANEPIPQLESTGRGLASVLADMKLNRDEDFQSLQQDLRAVVPLVKRVHFERRKVEWPPEPRASLAGLPADGPWGYALLLDMDGADAIPADLVSEGTLLVLGLLAVLYGPTRPKLLLLDDLDRGLHPRAQETVLKLLRKFLEVNPDTQILATTHSPYLLDHLKGEEVRLTNLREDGSVVCGRLTDHPEFAKWKDAMSPGEFWSHVGEGWVGQTRVEEPVP